VSEEVSVVERIFRDYIAGMSQMALAKALNADGVPTVKGSAWCQASVRRVLANPLYMGWLRHDGEVYRGEHEAIVSEELWRHAEARRAATARTQGGGGGRWPKGPHLLTKGAPPLRQLRPRDDPADRRRAAMSAVMGERALTLRLSEPTLAAEQIAERARQTPFAAVVGVDDQGVMAAALGAERLGLPHNAPDAVARTRDKAAMRRALAQAGVPQPRFAQLPPGADVAAVVSEVGLPASSNRWGCRAVAG
jgi:Recombinase/ATP-grasp N-terminal domain